MSDLEKQIQQYEKQLQTILDNGGTKQDKIYRQIGANLQIAQGMLRATKVNGRNQTIISEMLSLKKEENISRYNHDSVSVKEAREKIAAKMKELSQNELSEFLTNDSD